MKYLKLFEDYLDFIGKGSYHNVLEIDNDWVLKTPKSVGNKYRKYNDTNIKFYKTNNIQKIKIKFKGDITYMNEHPDIFPKVKQLDNYRAAVERCDTETAEKEIYHILKIINLHDKWYSDSYSIIHDLFFSGMLSDNLKFLKEYSIEHNDKIGLRWYNFIKLLHNNFTNRYDLHAKNFGINKNGEIKLIDF